MYLLIDKIKVTKKRPGKAHFNKSCNNPKSHQIRQSKSVVGSVEQGRMSLQLLCDVETLLFSVRVDEEGVSVGRLVVGVEQVQVGFQLLNLLLLDGPLVNHVPETSKV